MNHFVRHDNIKCLGHRGVHPPTEKMHSKKDVFFCLRKFATSGCKDNKDWVKKKCEHTESWQNW